MMVNNSTKIKMNNRLSPQLLNIKKTTTYDVGNPGPCLGQTQKCGGVKPVNGLPTPADNWISNCNTYIKKKKKKPMQTRFH
jgi:hypothetical protein